ncbi:hypothetical protein ACNKHO_20570 [Shigella flexneri]
MNNEDHRRRVLHSLEQALSKHWVKPASMAPAARSGGNDPDTDPRKRGHVLCNDVQPAMDAER